jgi:site-specific recombinase XerD
MGLRRGRPRVIDLTADQLGLRMKEVTTLAGLEPTAGLHKLRHTYCSRLAARGAPPEAIRRLARHKTMAVTMRYVHMDDLALESAIRLLDAPPAPSGS